MTGPTDSERQRTNHAVRLRHLSDSLSFHGLCRVLRCGGITLESVAPAVERKPHDFALEANNVARTFQEYGLANDIASWVGYWDGMNYHIPLTTADQAFLIARQRWMLFSNSDRDVPRRRWPELQQLTARIGADASKVVIAYLFGVTTTPAAASVVDAVVDECGVTKEQLYRIMGPCDPSSREYAGEVKQRGWPGSKRRQGGRRTAESTR